MKKILIILMMLALTVPAFAEGVELTSAEKEAELVAAVKAEASPKAPVEEPAAAEEELIPAAVIMPVEVANGYSLDAKGWWNDLWKDAHFSYDVYAKSTYLRGTNVPGGGISMGVETRNFRFESYGQADYFLKPLGGEGGAASMEMSAELGLSGAWKFLEFWAFDVWAGVDMGCFTQLLWGLPYPTANDMTMGFQGFMVRPKLLIELEIAKYYGLTFGVYYQMPVYPGYRDYSGLGIMFSIC